MSELSEADKATFHRIIGDAVKHYSDARVWGMVIPEWLQKQVDGIYVMETDPVRGMAEFADGLQCEVDHLYEVLHG
jgi:predicted transcriptional regulator